MSSAEATRILYVCTGNAARSVMAVTMTRARAPHLDVRGAGTFSISGQPMSQRTRNALAALDLSDPDHRSQQLEPSDCEWADLIVVFEPQHIEYMRRKLPDWVDRAATLPRLLRGLVADDDRALSDRLADLDLATVQLEPWEEVVDPAGGDQEVFDACALEISGQIDELLRLLP